MTLATATGGGPQLASTYTSAVPAGQRSDRSPGDSADNGIDKSAPGAVDTYTANLYEPGTVGRKYALLELLFPTEIPCRDTSAS